MISLLQMHVDVLALSNFSNVVIDTMLKVYGVLDFTFFEDLLYDTVLFLCNSVVVVSGAGRTGASLVFWRSPRIVTEE